VATLIRRLQSTFIGLAALAMASQMSLAQSNPVYYPLGPAKGVLYKPDQGPAPHVGIIVMHRTVNYLSHPACTEFSKRGFMVLCMNSRFDNNEVRVVWEQTALDVKAGVEFLKRQPGITKIVLFGHSGGAPTMAFYQAVAENGVAFCKEPQRLTKCGDELAGLPKADGIVFADAHPGYPMTVLRGFNGSVVDEATAKIDPSLDPFDPKNGYNPNGVSTYSADFQKRYFAAQSARMNRLIDKALAIKAKMAEGKYLYPDNDVLVVPMAGNPVGGPGGTGSLHVLDPKIASIMSTSRPEKLLRNDGTIETKIIASVAAPDPKSRETNRAFNTGTKVYSINSFLSANAIRSTNSLDGIDHCTSNNSTVCAVQSISVPQMFAAMGAANFIRDNETTFDASKAKDKDYVVIEGATHFFTPCTACETVKGQYSNARKNLFDYAAKWINARF